MAAFQIGLESYVHPARNELAGKKDLKQKAINLVIRGETR
jgi:hypothetical protein